MGGSVSKPSDPGLEVSVKSTDEVLELSEVRKRYGKLPALTGLNLRVGRGQVYGLLGRNGAGKSTALRIVMGITRADSGRVALFGDSIKASNVRARRRLGYVAQEQLFYDWMTPKQLGRFVGGFYPTWQSERFETLLRRFEVPARKVRTFSGGMKVKLALALALAHAPELLVLDEPTAGLDAVARREFLDIVRDQTTAGQCTTIFSSHLIDDVELLAGDVGLIDAGQMLYEGPLAELLSRVRRLVLPVVDTALVDGVHLRVIEETVRGGERHAIVLADSPSAFESHLPHAVRERLQNASLEDVFIAVVRARIAIPRLGVLHASQPNAAVKFAQLPPVTGPVA